jgi:hypothetical protein
VVNAATSSKVKIGAAAAGKASAMAKSDIPETVMIRFRMDPLPATRHV